VVRDGYNYVFSVGADNRASQVKVTIGRRMEGRIEVVDGLAANAQVVTSGAGFLTDGDLVRLSNENASPVKKVNLSKSN
jgi:multidrug efflux pump subunit AcrA (membrane-fusion protein)